MHSKYELIASFSAFLLEEKTESFIGLINLLEKRYSMYQIKKVEFVKLKRKNKYYFLKISSDYSNSKKECDTDLL